MPRNGLAQRRKSARKEQSDPYVQRRARLLRVAARLFREKSYANTSMAEIAAAAKIDRASVYYYVANKKELFQSVVTDVFRENVLAAEVIASGPGTPVTKLRLVMVSLMESYAQNYPHLYVYIQENILAITQDRMIRRLGRSYEDALTSILTEGAEQGLFRFEVSPRIITLGILGMLNWTHRWFKPAGPLTARQIGKAYADVVLDGLTSSSAVRNESDLSRPRRTG